MVCYEYLDEGEWLGHRYLTPEVKVYVQKPDGSGQQGFKMESDSGAAISLLPNGAAALLGLKLESGTPVTLGGVGGSNFLCYVHRCDLVIGEPGGEVVRLTQIPIAFGPTNDFPPLLGRLGVYEQVDILMDNTSQRATCVGATSPLLPPPLATSGISVSNPILLVASLAFLMLMVWK